MTQDIFSSDGLKLVVTDGYVLPGTSPIDPSIAPYASEACGSNGSPIGHHIDGRAANIDVVVEPITNWPPHIIQYVRKSFDRKGNLVGHHIDGRASSEFSVAQQTGCAIPIDFPDSTIAYTPICGPDGIDIDYAPDLPGCIPITSLVILDVAAADDGSPGVLKAYHTKNFNVGAPIPNTAPSNFYELDSGEAPNRQLMLNSKLGPVETFSRRETIENE